MTTPDTTASPPAAASAPSAEIALPIVGMTCASCVNRIDRFLRKADGVAEVSVNLATELATIRYLPDRVGANELAATIAAVQPSGGLFAVMSAPMVPPAPGR